MYVYKYIHIHTNTWQKCLLEKQNYWEVPGSYLNLSLGQLNININAFPQRDDNIGHWKEKLINLIIV